MVRQKSSKWGHVIRRIRGIKIAEIFTDRLSQIFVRTERNEQLNDTLFGLRRMLYWTGALV